MDAKEYLSYLQMAYGKEEILEENFNVYTEYLKTKGLSDSEIEIIINKVKAHHPKERPSYYQNPISYSIVMDILNEIEGFANILPKEVFPTVNENVTLPLFGTIDLGAFVAELKVSGDESIIIISEYVFHFAKQLSKIVSLFFKQVDNCDKQLENIFSLEINDIEEQINKDGHIVSAFCDLILATILGADIGKCVYEEDTVLSLGFEYSFMHFIVSHEYAHYILNHQSTVYLKDLKFDKVSMIIHDWVSEFEADEVGYILCMGATKETFQGDSIHATIGVILCFYAIELFEKIDKLKEKENIFSHPPARLRINKLVKEFFSSDDLKQAIPIFNDIMDALDFLWGYFTKVYNQYRDALKTLGWSESEKNYEILQYLMLYINGVV